MKVYLDTSIAIRFFKNFLKQKQAPFSLLFLKSLGAKIYASSLTFAEAFENLVKLDKKTFLGLSEEFLSFFRIKLIENFEVKDLLNLVLEFGLESKDAIHLSLAKQNKCYLLTADKKLCLKGLNFYPQILYLTDLYFL